MADVDIYIWNVERGDAIFINGPKHNAIIDLGQHANGFSPSKHISQNLGINSVSYLVLTHPDEDHIEDLPKFLSYFYPNVLGRRDEATPYIKRRKNILYPNRTHYQTITDKYLQLIGEFDRQAKYSPSDPEWNGGLTFTHHILSTQQAGIKPINQLGPEETVKLNNLSILTILEYGSFKMVTGGDLERDGIETLLDSKKFRNDIWGTDVLIAPHHGRENSYSPELFDYMSPDLVAISDAKEGSTNASSKYSSQATGANISRRSGSGVTRNVITTRNDGVLHIGVNSNHYSVKIN